MSATIHLMPEALANQIAAGEVVQRPASVVKELLENSVDAGSKSIKLIIKNSGKSLIQVVDDGSGMSEMDARMCFERHATSKIRKTEDLFNILTKGFRGEALASIAAVAQVELKTKRESDELGTRIAISGSTLTKQDKCQMNRGTSFSIKNLFFNVPVRRKFLKSDAVELKHILEEFSRIAMAHPDIFFSCFHNESEIYHLPSGNLRQRVVALFGKNVNNNLIPVFEETDFIRVEGFIGKPASAKKQRSNQYFLLNERFIKNHYLNHAVKTAYDNLIPEDHHPFFVLFISVDPTKVDINVHPTKQEVKFEEERLVYNYIRVSVKHSLGEYSLTPTIDFDQNINHSFAGAKGDLPQVSNRIERESFQTPPSMKGARPNTDSWQDIYEILNTPTQNQEKNATEGSSMTLESKWEDKESDIEQKGYLAFQLHGSYIISQIKSGLVVIDQQAAHQRIIYEKQLDIQKGQTKLAQQELFPESLKLDAQKSELLLTLLPSLNKLGFQIESFGKNTFVVQGLPAGLPKGITAENLIDIFLDQYTSNVEFQLGIDENIARSIAFSTSIKKGQRLDNSEMKQLIDQLFACKMPYKSPNGQKCFVIMQLDNIEDLFK